MISRYVQCLYVYNKVDMISIEDMDKLAREPNSIVVSVHMKLNLAALLVRIGSDNHCHQCLLLKTGG